MITNDNKHDLRPGAILPCGRVNVSLLEREIANELADEARFSAEDGMKKRAVHMSKDYDEFKNFVAVSQLKPIQSSEMGELFAQGRFTNSSASNSLSKSNVGNQKRAAAPNKACNVMDRSILYDLPSEFSATCSIHKHSSQSSNKDFKNNIVKKKKKRKSSASKQSKSSNKLIPKNAMEFEREWKLFCKTPSSTMIYLTMPATTHPSSTFIDNVDSSLRNDINLPISDELRVCPEYLTKLCTVEMDSYIMGGILEAIVYFISHMSSRTVEGVTVSPKLCSSSNVIINNNFVYRWMYSLTMCGRFSLNIDFLEEKQKDCINCILEHLKDVVHSNHEDTPTTKCMYTAEDILHLCNLYDHVFD